MMMMAEREVAACVVEAVDEMEMRRPYSHTFGQ